MLVTTDKSSEIRHFWHVSGELCHALDEGADPDEINSLFDEVECIMQATDLEMLRKRCALLLARRPATVDFIAG